MSISQNPKRAQILSGVVAQAQSQIDEIEIQHRRRRCGPICRMNNDETSNGEAHGVSLSAKGKIAYVVMCFPVLTETFILRD